MKMQMRRAGVARIADISQHGALPHRTRLCHVLLLQVGIERVCAIVELEHHMISVRLVDRQTIRQLAGRLVREIVAPGNHRSVRYGVNRLAVDVVTLHVLHIRLFAVNEALVGADLLPVDGKPLGQREASIERQQGSDVPDRVAATVARQIALALERRTENQIGGHVYRALTRGPDGEVLSRVQAS